MSLNSDLYKKNRIRTTFYAPIKRRRSKIHLFKPSRIFRVRQLATVSLGRPVSESALRGRTRWRAWRAQYRHRTDSGRDGVVRGGGPPRRHHSQVGDGLRLQRARPGLRGGPAALHRGHPLRAPAARLGRAAPRRRRKGRFAQSRPHPASVSAVLSHLMLLRLSYCHFNRRNVVTVL